MIRPISLTLSLALLSAPLAIFAQQGATESAVTESVRRDYNTRLLREKLAEAQEAERRGDASAAQRYEEAYTLVESIGQERIALESENVIRGLTDVRLGLARAAQKRNDFRGANDHIVRVLKVNPKNPQAIELKRANDKILNDLKGRIPSPDMVEKIPGWATNQINNMTKIQNAKLLFENGKYEEADLLLNQVLQAEPGNYTAAYYSSLIKEQYHASSTLTRELNSKERILEVEKAWIDPDKRSALPSPNPYFTNTLIHTSKQRQTIYEKLDRISFEKVEFDGLPLSEVVKFLAEQSRLRDPSKRGVNFVMSSTADSAAATAQPNPGGVTIDPTTGLPVNSAPVAADPVDMNSISIKINPAMTDLRLQDLLDIIVKVADRPIKYSVEDWGIIISLRAPEATPLYSRVFRVDPNTFWMGLVNVEGIDFGGSGGSSGGGGGNNSNSGGNRGGGNRGNNSGGGGGNQGGQGGGGGSSLTIPRVSVASGGGGSQGGRGGGNQGNQGNQGGSGLFGGSSGGSGGGSGGGGLPFITQQMSITGIQDAVREFFTAMGVDFGAQTGGRQGGGPGGGGGGGAGTTSNGKSIFFNDRQGTLFVRATLQDLDIIEKAVQVLNITPPQVNIRAKFAEVAQNDKRAIGVDWIFGNMALGSSGRMVGSAGTQPSLNGGNFPNNVFPGSPTAGTTIPPSSSDGVLTSALRNTANAPTLATLTGILTDPQFRFAIKALEQRDGVELLSAPDVTTVSGRQAQLQVVDLRTIVTGPDNQQTSSSGGGGNDNNNNNNNGGGGVVAASINYATEALPFGPVLDVIPYVSADGFTVHMVIIPTITEFIGYDDPGQFVPQSQSVSAGGTGLPLTAVLPLPHYRVRQVTTTSIIWDGQTIVLGGLLSENVSKVKDKVPVLGDLPFIGRAFRSESNISEKKNLLIFVTPTIIDPAGNRVHTDDNMPFSANTIPPQRPVVQP